MELIKQEYEIKARPEEVFAALLDPEIIQRWSGAPATMEGKVGGRFALFDGRITGVNVEIVKDQKVVQDWQYGGWESPSKVTFTLTQRGATGDDREWMEGTVPRQDPAVLRASPDVRWTLSGRSRTPSTRCPAIAASGPTHSTLSMSA
jgi:uncharacterized protein YndB with AHSA1/START domain